MKIGIIGFGAIGFDVAKKLDQEKDQFNVIGVHSKTKSKIIDKTTSFNSRNSSFVNCRYVLAIILNEPFEFQS